MLKHINPTKTSSWKDLQAHFLEIKDKSIKDHFRNNSGRVEELSRQFNDIYLDFSKNHLTKETVGLLVKLASELSLNEAIQAMKAGEKINEREGRAVLHTALRSKEDEIRMNGQNLIPLVRKELDHVKVIANDIQSGRWIGHTGKRIKHLVNIGIGGSDLGPQMVCNALKPYWKNITPHFLSNIDASHWEEIKENIHPEETIFIIASKTFTTDETMTNAQTVRTWFLNQLGSQEALRKHFIAISTNLEEVENFGIPKENILGFWDWVGGRFSLWSSIGLSIACTIGWSNFEAILDGAREMDDHFFSEDFDKNLPVLLALISIWQVNFWGYSSKAILPYDHNLRDLPRFLQQLLMESNGKQMDRTGKRITYSTCPVLFGEPGTNGQHAFFQLLHQGTDIIPSDFIVAAVASHSQEQHHSKLLSNCFAQSEALMDGQVSDDPFRNFDGNRPSNTLVIKELLPRNLGSLIALYEHQVFVQGVVWNIYSFDQWGVELGKQLAKKINNKEASSNSSTNELLNKVQSFRS
ncbi:MAG: glucose-6-phosphate isomerase [Cytophagales bacterium]|nr:glucose-6-phosphate isomerase [Cytophagales bacterium]